MKPLVTVLTGALLLFPAVSAAQDAPAKKPVAVDQKGKTTPRSTAASEGKARTKDASQKENRATVKAKKDAKNSIQKEGTAQRSASHWSNVGQLKKGIRNGQHDPISARTASTRGPIVWSLFGRRSRASAQRVYVCR